MKEFTVGQRWINESELDLGLGIIKEVQDRRVSVYFPAVDCSRLYAKKTAPLTRFEIKISDTVFSRDGMSFELLSIEINNGIILYRGECKNKAVTLSEQNLKDTLSISSAEEKYKYNIFDKNNEFNLRLQSLFLQNKILKSPTRGFSGGRIELIPHQLYIASCLSKQQYPRVLLCDETGLGKTIEAALVLHRLLLNSRIKRVLILLPDALVLQWFVELLRKFNLVFQIVDEAYCKLKDKSNYTGNVFLEEQLYICSIDYLTSDKNLQNLSLTATWDMLVVDEVHHIKQDSSFYNFLKELSQHSKGLLLLSATPEQNGYKHHFARLQLLDPERYFSFKDFVKEEQEYSDISSLLKKIKNKKNQISNLSDSDIEKLKNYTKQTHFNKASLKDKKYVNVLANELLDSFGPGRAIFQNSRSAMSGFPEREVHLIALDPDKKNLQFASQEYKLLQDQSTESINFELAKDKRLLWLQFLLKELKQEKILLICHTKKMVKTIERTLKDSMKLSLAVFHEDLSLLQRDRNAARFADSNGARILICSEIGSEGRNFQFAHHLVLFDLPLHPELLEQRIGRLDRIGQTKLIHIYVPYLIGSENEILAKWYNEGLNVFLKNIPGVHSVYKKFKNELEDILSLKKFSKLPALIRKTRIYCKNIFSENSKGKDFLLALNSFDAEVARKIILKIQNSESVLNLEAYMLSVFDHFGIEYDYKFAKTYQLDLSKLTSVEFPLPVLHKDDLTITFDRSTALSYENFEYLSPDHPMIIQVIEYILSTGKGKCLVCSIPVEFIKKITNGKKSSIFLEAVFIQECITAQTLQIDRYLPATPIRKLVNHLQENCEQDYSVIALRENTNDCVIPNLLFSREFKAKVFPKMIDTCKFLAKTNSNTIKEKALQKVEKNMHREINRLRKLQDKNKNIKDFQISNLLKQKDKLLAAVKNSRLRLDSFRIIISDDLLS